MDDGFAIMEMRKKRDSELHTRQQIEEKLKQLDEERGSVKKEVKGITREKSRSKGGKRT